jgi:hypothetical protein
MIAPNQDSSVATVATVVTLNNSGFNNLDSINPVLENNKKTKSGGGLSEPCINKGFDHPLGDDTD